MDLLGQIEKHLRITGVAATRFGRDVVRDPRFVLDLRNGRTPRVGTIARVEAHLARAAEGAR